MPHLFVVRLLRDCPSCSFEHFPSSQFHQFIITSLLLGQLVSAHILCSSASVYPQILDFSSYSVVGRRDGAALKLAFEWTKETSDLFCEVGGWVLCFVAVLL